MHATYTSPRYSPDKVLKRYVKRVGALYHFCEVGADRRYDLRQGIVDAAELPTDVRAKADARAGHWPAYVDW